ADETVLCLQPDLPLAKKLCPADMYESSLVQRYSTEIGRQMRRPVCFPLIVEGAVAAAAPEIKFVVPVDSGEILDDVVKSVRPLWVLELRMHCGYSSGRLLRLLPHGGRLITVVLDPVTADLGEEIILVAGFNSRFLPSSAEAIPTLNSFSDGINLVLMDHDSQQYLLDLLALEREELLCPSGCTVLLNRGIKEPTISEESWITPEEESIPTASKLSIHL
uniref:catechol O-methyltransferase n=1 Tax=Maylandia zebra TaxID=106582 RepID=A0A3P9B1B0_9CICH